MIEVIALPLMALACWRLSVMIAREEGPLEAFVMLRIWLGQKFDEESKPFIPPYEGRNLFQYIRWSFVSGLTCVWCASVWWGIFFTLLWLVAPNAAMGLALPFALSAAAIAMERLVGDG
jgi:hypothetical protein